MRPGICKGDATSGDSSCDNKFKKSICSQIGRQNKLVYYRVRSVPGHWQGRDDCVLDATRQGGCREARLEGGRGDAILGEAALSALRQACTAMLWFPTRYLVKSSTQKI